MLGVFLSLLQSPHTFCGLKYRSCFWTSGTLVDTIFHPVCFYLRGGMIPWIYTTCWQLPPLIHLPYRHVLSFSIPNNLLFRGGWGGVDKEYIYGCVGTQWHLSRVLRWTRADTIHPLIHFFPVAGRRMAASGHTDHYTIPIHPYIHTPASWISSAFSPSCSVILSKVGFCPSHICGLDTARELTGAATNLPPLLCLALTFTHALYGSRCFVFKILSRHSTELYWKGHFLFLDPTCWLPASWHHHFLNTIMHLKESSALTSCGCTHSHICS